MIVVVSVLPAAVVALVFIVVRRHFVFGLI